MRHSHVIDGGLCSGFLMRIPGANTICERNSVTKLRMSGHGRTIPVVAVTGGIGSGKSTVAEIFEKAGAYVIDADSLAKRILWEDERIHRRVIAEFGPEICDENGRIEKERLIPVVFRDRQAVQKLNAVVHPAVIDTIDKKTAEIRTAGMYPMIVVDAALIFEAGIENKFDYIVSVIADKKVRTARIVRRDGVPPVDVRRRMNAQIDAGIHREKSDFVIHNDGSRADLLQQTRLIIEKIVHTALHT